MTDPFTVVTLEARTVFHTELGQVQTQQDVDELEMWLIANIHGDWRIHGRGVWFADGKDAMLCKLTWGGS